MEGGVLLVQDARADLVSLDQLLDILRAMVDCVVPAQVRVFVGNRVEAVRTLGNHFLDVIAVQGLNVLLGQHAVEILVAQTPRRVARTAFLFAQNGEAHAGLL